MLKSRIHAAEKLVGTFLKTGHYSLIEVLGRSGLDFVILDTEHSPFTHADVDRCILAAKAVNLPILVRLVEGDAARILQVLDMGADGIVIPQVKTMAQAQAIVRATEYGANGRGFAGTNRAGGYGTIPIERLVKIAKETVVVLQIEDSEGVQNIDDIVSTSGVDACFVGRADLSVAMEVFDVNHPAVVEATQRVLDACNAGNVVSMVFASDMTHAADWFVKGVTLVAVGSEHQALLSYFSDSRIADIK
ncbi:HpcH/HpaI aldolase family protein [Marinobacterium rhizophilum]|uniref:HpcH/HpaI aldolase/citrate lyase domain-containing protein n=1 Tax=Marinobacterium rhizophilum TaxID=420402 RepID=A0ABY5HQC7_9GAMM|nr:aldolase/citrate lyase family protein [Marinobacterium rhizophilum]UTW13412.1 hypothetical protein KDW95_07120 [Marinobacterium rhizophilum]